VAASIGGVERGKQGGGGGGGVGVWAQVGGLEKEKIKAGWDKIKRENEPLDDYVLGRKQISDNRREKDTSRVFG